MSREEERLYSELNAAPGAARSAQTAQAAAELAAAERAAQSADYSHTADGRLDRAINEYLSKSGFDYDLSRDNSYRDFAREYSQNALRGRAAAQEGANMLSGGYTPTYAGAVGSEVQSDIGANLANYTPAFRAAARQEAAADAARAGQTAQIYQSIADTGYARDRDTQQDRMNALTYLAQKYSGERQADAQRQEAEGDIWRTKLSSAAENAAQERSLDNSRYTFDTQSAQSAAKLAADQEEFERKLEYTKAKDAYDERAAEAKAAATQQEKLAKEQAKEQEKVKKEQEKHDENRKKLLFALSGKYDLTKSERVSLDYNEDGNIDDDDLNLATIAAGGKVAMRNSAEAQEVITNVREKKRMDSYRGYSLADIVQESIEKRDLDIPEAMYVYNYFGL